jgi:hypothetical protein
MRRLVCLFLTACILASASHAQEAQENGSSREQRIADYLSGSKFVGRYTTDRDDSGAAKPETYTINKVQKLPEPDLYRLTTRIQYGETDTEVPIDLKILWSGNTPVITLDNLWIPGMGTFSARVLIHEGRYAGTWSHDAKGGHLFGRIEKSEPQSQRD